MAAESSSLFVQMRELEANYKEVESFQQKQAQTAKRTTKLALLAAAIMGLANLGLAWTVASLLPLTKLVPVYLLIRPDGHIAYRSDVADGIGLRAYVDRWLPTGTASDQHQP